jgi:hypothetical protein
MGSTRLLRFVRPEGPDREAGLSICSLWHTPSLLTMLKRFSTSLIIMNRLDNKTRVQVINWLIEACSIRSTVRMTGVAKSHAAASQSWPSMPITKSGYSATSKRAASNWMKSGLGSTARKRTAPRRLPRSIPRRRLAVGRDRCRHEVSSSLEVGPARHVRSNALC